MESITLNVPGMTCGHCEAAVRDELTRLDSVHSVEVDLDTKLVVVLGDDLDPAELAAAVDEAGYEVVS